MTLICQILCRAIASEPTASTPARAATRRKTVVRTRAPTSGYSPCILAIQNDRHRVAPAIAPALPLPSIADQMPPICRNIPNAQTRSDRNRVIAKHHVHCRRSVLVAMNVKASPPDVGKRPFPSRERRPVLLPSTPSSVAIHWTPTLCAMASVFETLPDNQTPWDAARKLSCRSRPA